MEVNESLRMKHVQVFIPIYNWNIDLFLEPSCSEDLAIIENELSKNGVGHNEFVDVMKSISLNRANAGNTLYNEDERRMFVITGIFKNRADFWQVLHHEMDHVLFHIKNIHGLNCPESSGYLSGFLWEALYNFGIFDYELYNERQGKLLSSSLSNANTQSPCESTEN